STDLLRLDTLQSVREALDTKEWDVVLCDYALPGFNGLDVLQEFTKRSLDIPFIVISGEIGEDTAVSLMKSGAHDYIFKGNLKPLIPVIQREIRESENRKKSRENDQLREAEARKYRAMIDAAYDAITLFDKEILLECNTTTSEIFGIRGEDILGKNLRDLAPPAQPDETDSMSFFRKRHDEALNGIPQNFEIVLNRGDGTSFDAEVTLKVLDLPEGQRTQATFRDITERKRVEREMKDQMETIRELQQQEMTMINQNPLPLLLMDLNLRILKVNESFLQMSGFTETQLLAMKAHDFKIIEKSGMGLKEAVKTKKAVTGNLIVEFPAGIHHIEQDIIPLLDKHDKVSSVMSTYKDRTDEIGKEKEIQRMIQEAKDHSSALDASAQDLAGAFEKVSAGDLTASIAVREDDPLGVVKNDAIKTVGALRNALQEVNRVSGEVSDTMQEISKGSESIAQAAMQVVQTVQQSAETGKDLIAHIEDITDQISTLSASNEEITSTSQEILKHAQDVTVRGSEAQALGNEANDRMDVVKQIAQESVEDIEELNSQIREINKIVKMINDIAGQINLLSLNAAIEAARAGDAGRGFAVVAGEVKNLAADARKATDHISDVINAIQRSSEKTSTAIRSSHSEIAHGVESVTKTIESLNQMVNGASEVTRDMQEIVRAIEDQANISTSVVNTAHEGLKLTGENLKQVEELSTLAEQVSASVEEINSAIMEVGDLTSQLKTEIHRFKV
ncbi:MAG: methyl-accepting chemotaxis protein, partial [Methanospirillum sp.]|uniref:methyl-accepting chemotaxis protein n=1 Tax=Methanospirillum sp. TaxID=45200 RepID=UPI0023754F12